MDARADETLKQVAADLGGTYDDEDGKPHVEVRGEGGTVDAFFATGRYLMFSDYHQKAMTAYAGDPDLDAPAIETTLRELLRDYAG